MIFLKQLQVRNRKKDVDMKNDEEYRKRGLKVIPGHSSYCCCSRCKSLLESNKEYKAFQVLETLGVPIGRAKSVSNGILVYSARMEIEVELLKSELEKKKGISLMKIRNNIKKEIIDLRCDSSYGWNKAIKTVLKLLPGKYLEEAITLLKECSKHMLTCKCSGGLTEFSLGFRIETFLAENGRK